MTTKPKKISNQTSLIVVLILTLTQFFGVFNADINPSGPPLEDALFYQPFVEDLLKGQINTSGSGFQGSSFPAIILHLFWPNTQSFVITQLFFGIATIPLIFIVTKQIFERNKPAIIATLLYALMPDVVFSGLHGYPQGFFNFSTLFVVYLLLKNSKLTGLAFGWSLISKPFSIALFPFFIKQKQIKPFIFGCLIGLFYLAIQINLAGQIMIGAHKDLNATNVFKFEKIGRSLASAPQFIFSVHAYSPNGDNTLGDRLHTSPLVAISALLVVFHMRNKLPKKHQQSLIYFSIFSFSLAALIGYIDPIYLHTFIFSIIWLSLPALESMPILLFGSVLTSYYSYLFVSLPSGRYWGQDYYWIFSIPVVCTFVLFWLEQTWLSEQIRNTKTHIKQLLFLV